MDKSRNLAALFSRTQTGEGQKIETCLFSTGMALLATGFAKIEELDQERHQKELDFLSTAFREGKTHTQIIDTISEMRLRHEMPGSTRPLELPD